MFKPTHIVTGTDEDCNFAKGVEVYQAAYWGTIEGEPNHQYFDAEGTIQIISASGVKEIK